MKKRVVFLLSLSLPLFLAACALGRTPAERIYFAVELKGKLIGYSETSFFPGEKGKCPSTEIVSKAFLALKALGQDFDLTVESRRKVDPATGKVLYVDTDLVSGTMKMGSTILVEGDTVSFTPKAGGKKKTLTLEPGAIVDDDLSFPYLVRDLGGADPGGVRTYKVLDPMKGEIHEKVFTLEKKEKLRLCGKEYDCLVFEALDRTNGTTGRIWVDPASAWALKSEQPNDMVSYLADASVKDKVERGDLDTVILGDVKTGIADFKAITYMKVKAKIRTAGEWVTPESLNVPGQKFTGEVKDNLVDGVFEIAHPRYDGKDAPPFPPDFGGTAELKKYLEPENLIESDDPAIVNKAREITAGAKDSWDAARRLSKWVADNIAYKIPGGSARHTLDTLKGECGSHSRLLTAFCRTAGIPARIVSGCMYTPLHGGSFGQHAWNEIYMGRAGWITVDSTAGEIDYVDSGHIRLGEETSFNPLAMEILDYKAGALSMGEKAAGLGAMEEFPWKEGEAATYTYAYKGKRLGTDAFTLKSVEKDAKGGTVLSFESDLEITGLSAKSKWRLDGEGRPLLFSSQGKTAGGDYSISCAFSEKNVAVEAMQAGKSIQRTVPLEEGVRLIGNNNVGILACLAAAAPRKEGEARAFKFFHPSSMQVLPGQITAKGTETIVSLGKKVSCRVLDLSLAGTAITMWVDGKGRLLKETEAGGALVIERAAEK